MENENKNKKFYKNLAHFDGKGNNVVLSQNVE